MNFCMSPLGALIAELPGPVGVPELKLFVDRLLVSLEELPTGEGVKAGGEYGEYPGLKGDWARLSPIGVLNEPGGAGDEIEGREDEFVEVSDVVEEAEDGGRARGETSIGGCDNSAKSVRRVT